MILRGLVLSALLVGCGGGGSASTGGGDLPGGGSSSTSMGGAAAGGGSAFGGGANSGGAPTAVCGNGAREGGEACDQDDLGEATCADFGMTGQLGCSPSCELDPTACVGCGNGFLDPGEVCDGDVVADGCLAGADPAWVEHLVTDLGIEPHAVIDGVRGAPTCLPTCELDFSSCGYCFNGVIEPAESCELTGLGLHATAEFGGATCESEGYGPGDLGCLACGILVDRCSPLPPPPCVGGNCSLRFDSSWAGGISNSVDVPTHPSFGWSGALTVEYWMRYQGISGSIGYFGLTSSKLDLVPGFRLGFFGDMIDTVSWQGSWGAASFVSSAPGILGAPWRHLAGVLDPTSGTSRLYVDGQLVAENPLRTLVGPSPDAPPSLRIGWPLEGSYVAGRIFDVDEIRISSSARYDGDFVPQPVLAVDADTLALWHVDDNSAALSDSGPYGLHGLIGANDGGVWIGEHP